MASANSARGAESRGACGLCALCVRARLPVRATTDPFAQVVSKFTVAPRGEGADGSQASAVRRQRAERSSVGRDGQPLRGLNARRLEPLRHTGGADHS